MWAEPPEWIHAGKAHGQAEDVTATFRAEWLGFHDPSKAGFNSSLVKRNSRPCREWNLGNIIFAQAHRRGISQRAFLCLCVHAFAPSFLSVASPSLSSKVLQIFQMTLHPLPGKKCSAWLVPILSFPLTNEGIFLQVLCVPKVTLF